MNVLFVGLDNPQSADPRKALYPLPNRCTGHRLWKMMEEVSDKPFGMSAYHRIPKTNLFSVGMFPKGERRRHLERAGGLLISQLEGSGKNVILMGSDVRNAVFTADIKPKAMKWHSFGGDNTRYAWISHPSGRNHYYNDTRKRRRVARFLLEVCRG